MWSSLSNAERGVYSDQLYLEQDIWSEHCQNPLQSSSQPKTTRATAHQSKTGLNTSVATREKLVWECECIKKFSDDIFLLMQSKYIWVDKPQSIFFKPPTMLGVVNWITASWVWNISENICSILNGMEIFVTLTEAFFKGNRIVWLITNSEIWITLTAHLSVSY